MVTNYRKNVISLNFYRLIVLAPALYLILVMIQNISRPIPFRGILLSLYGLLIIVLNLVKIDLGGKTEIRYDEEIENIFETLTSAEGPFFQLYKSKMSELREKDNEIIFELNKLTKSEKYNYRYNKEGKNLHYKILKDDDLLNEFSVLVNEDDRRLEVYSESPREVSLIQVPSYLIQDFWMRRVFEETGFEITNYSTNFGDLKVKI